MAGCVIHLLVASASVDSKQVVHQFDGANRFHILLVELDCVDKVPSRMAPTGRMHHLCSAHAMIVSRIAVRLKKSLEVDKEMRRAFATATHTKIEDYRTSRRSVLPQV